MKPKRRTYVVERRYTYWAVDEYTAAGECSRTVATGLTKKGAAQLKSRLEDAIYYLLLDNKLD